MGHSHGHLLQAKGAHAFGVMYDFFNGQCAGGANRCFFFFFVFWLGMDYYEDNRLVSGSLDGTVRIWDLTRTKEELIGTYTGHKQAVKCVSCDGRRVVSGSSDKTVNVHDIEDDGSYLYALLFPDWITCLAFDETSLVGGVSDGTLMLFSYAPNNKE